MEELIIDLYNIGSIKFGDFILKNNNISPILIDFSILVSYPNIINRICNLMIDILKNINFDSISSIQNSCIPYTSIISNKILKPFIIIDSKKNIKRDISNSNIYNYKNIVIINDFINTGNNIISHIDFLKKQYNNININDVIVICDRRYNNNYNNLIDKTNIHSLFNVYDILNILLINNKINTMIFNRVYNYINKNEIFTMKAIINKNNKNLTLKRLSNIITNKKTNIIFSSNIRDFFELVKIIPKISKNICILKIHSDTIDNFTYEKALLLKKMSNELNFLILDDRKFCDLGHIFKIQYTLTNLKLYEWVDIVSINSNTIDSFNDNNSIYETFSILNKDFNKAILPICDMSNDNLTSFELNNRKNKLIKLLDKYKDHILGIETQKRDDYIYNDNVFYINPYISINNNNKIYKTPQKATLLDNCDLMTIGDDITNYENIEIIIKRYKTICWNVLSKRF